MIEFVAMTTALPQEKPQVESGVIRKYPLERRYYYTDYKGDAKFIDDLRERHVRKLKSEPVKIIEPKPKTVYEQSICPAKKKVVVYFDFDKSNLKPLEKERIDKAFEELKSKKLKVYISAYTDKVGSKTYNDILALKRAKTVQDYVKKYTKDICIKEAKGKCCYVSKKDELNRRAEIEIEYKEKCKKSSL